MKRRLVSQTVHKNNVCFFCAFRPRVYTPFRLARQLNPSKSIASTSYRSQESAARQKDQESNEFSMLKQNAGLAFPTKAKSKPPPPPPPPSEPDPDSHPSQQPARRFPGVRAFRPTADHVQETGNGPEQVTARSRVSYTNSSTQQDKFSQTGQARRNQQFQNWRDATNDDQRSGLGGVDREQGRFSFRRSGQHRPSLKPDASSVRSNAGPSGFTERQRESKLRNTEIQPNVQRANNRAWEARTQATQQDRDNTQRPLRITRLHSNDQHTSELPNLGHRAQDRRLEDRHDWKTGRESRTKAQTPRMDEEQDASEPNIETPADSSFDAIQDDGHRRDRRDRRPRRSDRFEDPEEAEKETPSPQMKQRAHRRFDFEMAEAEEMLYGGGKKKKKQGQKQVKAESVTRPGLQIPEFVSVERLARMLKVDLDKFIQQLEEEGFEGARYDHILDSGTSSMFADLYGFEPSIIGSGPVEDLVPRPAPEDPSLLPPRPPIVTIMGHVDHGKTTILDYLRKSSVVSTEHGGITQHIGAFSVRMPGTQRQITFLDTPGHAAFLEMRRRGANVTDIVVLVVAADDSVKPQTIEAIKHAREANVQVIVAINKVDKADADIERVKQDLTRYDIVVEDYGGEYQVIPLSGKTGQGMTELEEAIVTLADVYDFRAENDGPAEGWVIESKVTMAGRTATVLVRRGTLRPGDFIVAGTTWARVRTLRNDAGQIVTEAAPGTPVQVDGWRGEDPTAGLEVLQADSEDHAKEVVDLRLAQRENVKLAADLASINTVRTEEAEARAKVLAWEKEQEWAKRGYKFRPKDNEGWVEQHDETGPKKVHFVIKADVAGSVEALVAAVSAIGNNEVMANVIYSGTGLISESDVKMLAATGETGYLISFNQSLDGTAARLAEAAGLQILDHNVIYKVTDTVKERLAEHLPPIITQRVLGEAEIGQVFEITLKKSQVKIAGCRVTNGTISRSNKIRVQRNGAVIYTGTLSSLKNVKKDVTEMRKGTECGMGFDNWQDFQPGDQIQCFEELEEKRTLY